MQSARLNKFNRADLFKSFLKKFRRVCYTYNVADHARLIIPF